jgi:hypothetical protein
MKTVPIVFTLLSVVVVEAANASSCSSSKTLSCGTTVTDSLNASGAPCVLDTFPTAVYRFDGVPGQAVDMLASNSNGYDIGLVLYDASGNRITNNFDEPSGIHAALTAFGPYTVEINFGNPHQSGTFTLATSCTTPITPPPTQCNYTATVAIGSTITSQLSANDAACGYSESYGKAYRLPVTAGDTFEIDYSAAGFQPYLEIKGPDTSEGYRWARSPTTALTAFYVAPTSGDVTIYAMSNDQTPVTGAFTLTILPYTQPSCGRPRAVRH